MKNGKCPMCNSTEVYMCDSVNVLESRSDNLHFQAMQDSDTAIYRFQAYVCTDCGFTAMFAKGTQSLTFLRKADNWHKVV